MGDHCDVWVIILLIRLVPQSDCNQTRDYGSPWLHRAQCKHNHPSSLFYVKHLSDILNHNPGFCCPHNCTLSADTVCSSLTSGEKVTTSLGIQDVFVDKEWNVPPCFASHGYRVLRRAAEIGERNRWPPDIMSWMAFNATRRWVVRCYPTMKYQTLWTRL